MGTGQSMEEETAAMNRDGAKQHLIRRFNSLGDSADNSIEMVEDEEEAEEAQEMAVLDHPFPDHELLNSEGARLIDRPTLARMVPVLRIPESRSVAPAGHAVHANLLLMYGRVMCLGPDGALRVAPTDLLASSTCVSSDVVFNRVHAIVTWHVPPWIAAAVATAESVLAAEEDAVRSMCAVRENMRQVSVDDVEREFNTQNILYHIFVNSEHRWKSQFCHRGYAKTRLIEMLRVCEQNMCKRYEEQAIPITLRRIMRQCNEALRSLESLENESA